MLYFTISVWVFRVPEYNSVWLSKNEGWLSYPSLFDMFLKLASSNFPSSVFKSNKKTSELGCATAKNENNIKSIEVLNFRKGIVR